MYCLWGSLPAHRAQCRSPKSSVTPFFRLLANSSHSDHLFSHRTVIRTQLLRSSNRNTQPSSFRATEQETVPSVSPEFGTLTKDDYPQFVKFLHLASPYVVGHRGRTFVIVIPGDVIINKVTLARILDDITLLHGLGARLVIVAGAKDLIDMYLSQRGIEHRWVGAYRVTNEETLQAAIEAAGRTVTEITAHLSKAISIGMVRRHSRGEGKYQFSPAVQVVNGNYVTAKRRGIIHGIDFGFMGQVRFVQQEAISRQLDAGNIVLLTNIGVSASGELLNCNAFDVATHAAVELRADKMLCITTADVRALNLPHYLPLDDAEQLIYETTATQSGSDNEMEEHSAVQAGRPCEDAVDLDLDSWQQVGFPNAVLAAVVACTNGVMRAHLIDSELDGGLLLELYTRDGINGVCMIAADLYEGIRPAEARDYDGILIVLRQLEEAGFALPYAIAWDIAEQLTDVTVLEREGKVLACCCTRDVGVASDGCQTFEISAFVVHKDYRGAGHGDSLLDWVEQDLRRRGARRVVLLPGSGSHDWFTQRGFEVAGLARTCTAVPEERRALCGPIVQAFVKPILELDASLDAPAGKRIGF